MPKKRTDEEIRAMIRSHYRDVNHISELTGGLASQTYLFESCGQRFVFKSGTRKEVHRKEQWVYNQYHQQLPLRSVAHIYEAEDQSAYAIYNYIEGVKLLDLGSQELNDTVPSMLNTLSILRSIDADEGAGYGRFDGSGTAPYPTWRDFVEAIYNDPIYNWSLAEKKGLDLALIEDAINELRRDAGSIALTTNRQLVHGDLGSGNILARGRRVTGLIDWSLALYGDHLYDIANFMFWNEAKLQPLIARLQADYLNSEDNRRTVRCYKLRIGLEELYNTVILNEPGYDTEWVANRLQHIANEPV